MHSEWRIKGIIIILAIGASSLLAPLSESIFPENYSAMDMTTAGTLESVTVSEGVFSDTSTMVLADGTHIRVKGAVNPWTSGASVQHPVSKSKDNNKQKVENTQWCISGTCYSQI
ncbi:hypothetical protein QE443_004685 [Pantoea ananatis]|uniref:hypothetical protein n=1 Tax=Pantoea ananas TaxID=553 RepID=UPI002789B10C|nr:hypothetical protein [Pantoea ananatis]MDQ1228424.1 hypothetical protein [Pantoea ananatis]